MRHWFEHCANAKLKTERDILKKRQRISRGSEGMTAIGPKECPNR